MVIIYTIDSSDMSLSAVLVAQEKGKKRQFDVSTLPSMYVSAMLHRHGDKRRLSNRNRIIAYDYEDKKFVIYDTPVMPITFDVDRNAPLPVVENVTCYMTEKDITTK